MTTTHHPPAKPTVPGTAPAESVEAEEAVPPAAAASLTVSGRAGRPEPVQARAESVPGHAGADAAEDRAAAEEAGAPADEDAAEESRDGVEAPAAPGRLRRLVRRAAGWPRRRVAAVAVLLVAVLASGGLLYGAAELRDPAATGNRALTDTAATDQVTGDVSNALSRIFAYTPDDTRSTAQAARDVLAGRAATQYQSLFAQIREEVASQRLTLTTRVVRAGVVLLTAQHARLLVFLDQTAQRAGAAATSAAAQLSVTAEYRGGHWRITELTAR